MLSVSPFRGLTTHQDAQILQQDRYGKVEGSTGYSRMAAVKLPAILIT